MKRMLDQKLIDALNQIDFEELASDTAWVSQIKELISYNEEDECIEITTLSVLAELYLESISSLKNENDDSFFPSLTDQAGKVVKVNEDETGFEYGEVSGGTQLYKHSIKLSKSSAYPSSPVDIALITTSQTPLEYSDVASKLFSPSNDLVQFLCLAPKVFVNTGTGGATIIGVCSFDNSTGNYGQPEDYAYMFGTDNVIDL